MQYTTLQHFVHNTQSTGYSLLINLKYLNQKCSLPICILFNNAASKAHVSLYEIKCWFNTATRCRNWSQYSSGTDKGKV